MTSSAHIETVSAGDITLAMVIRGSHLPDRTTFVTPDSFKQQLGYIVYPAGASIKRHKHIPIERHLVGTSEVIIVRKGKCSADLYDDALEFVQRVNLDEGDILILAAGAHGFDIHEDCVLMEIKQGPYVNAVEKEHF